MEKSSRLLFVFLLVLASWNMTAQEKTITGTVTSQTDGSPLPGAAVVVGEDANRGALTDFDGKYTIQASVGESLVISFIGMETVTLTVGSSNVMDVVMVEGADQLDEVVITALGIEKEVKALGYSLTELDGEQMTAVPEVNAINALQGKVAGVNITRNATGAAGSSRVVIRGASSLTGNNQPLYVVDGIPISNENNGAAGLWGGSDGGDGISSINPNDIESVSVLKGGAASALYGSRASNGVIIVTTKSGKGRDGFGVELSSSYTFDKVNTDLQDYQTSYGQGLRGEKPTSAADAQNMGLSSWGPLLDGTSVVQWDGELRPYSYVGNNMDHFYETGSTFINSLAVSNSSDNFTFRFSATDMANEDVMPNAGLDRNSFSLNATSVTAEKLTVSVNAKYIIEKVQNRPRLSDAPGNANFTVAMLSPNVDVRFMEPGTNEDGTERVYSNNIYSQNPYFAAYNFRNEDVKNRLIASGSLRYDITDNLYALYRAGIDHYTIKRTAVTPYGTAYQPLGSIGETEIRYTQIDQDFLVGYNNQITDRLNVSAFVGVNGNEVEQETLSLNGDRFIVPGLEDIGNTENGSRSRGYSKRKIGSVYGSAEVSWDNWAYLTFTGRNDWFSTLSFPGKTTPNDDFYPSISGSVIFSELFDLGDAINFLKLRGGYSQVAGGAQDPYQLSLTYSIFGQQHLGQSLGQINGGNVPNANLVAYNKDETEIGVDARFLGNRLSVDLAYYTNLTKNDIVPVTTSVFSGYGSALANIGEVKNNGIELLVSGTPVQTENFYWKTSVNVSHNKSEIVATNDDDAEIGLGEPRTRNVEIKQIVGEEFGTIVGVSYVRDDAGNIVYDIDGDGVPIAQLGPRKILGVGVPPTQWGWSNTFSFKNWSLFFLIDGKSGGQIFSGTNAVLTGNGLHKNTTEGRESGLQVTGVDGSGAAFNVVVAPEDLATYHGRISGIAEEFVSDADFIKFRQLRVGYDFPRSILDKTFLQNVNVSFIANNLFYISRSVDNIDPESAYNVGNTQGLEYFGVPSTRSYGFNLNVKF